MKDELPHIDRVVSDLENNLSFVFSNMLRISAGAGSKHELLGQFLAVHEGILYLRAHGQLSKFSGIADRTLSLDQILQVRDPAVSHRGVRVRRLLLRNVLMYAFRTTAGYLTGQHHHVSTNEHLLVRAYRDYDEDVMRR